MKTALDIITENGLGRAADFLKDSDALELINIPREVYMEAMLSVFPLSEQPDEGILMSYVQHHLWALSYVFQNQDRLPTVHDCLELHRRLMQNSNLSRGMIGNFRQTQVTIGPNLGANPVSVPYFMDNLCFDLKNGFDPLDAHIRYEIIHPFIDGNGRTGRLFWLWLRLHKGGNIQPFLDACGYKGETFQERRAAYHQSIDQYRRVG